MLRCVARLFPVYSAYGYIIGQPFFYSAETRMRMNPDHVASDGETFIASSLIGSNKGMPAV